MIDTNFFSEMRTISINELATACDFKIIGDSDISVSNISTLEKAQKSDLSFFANKKYLSDLKTTNAGAVILSEDYVKFLPENTIGLISSNPNIGYAKALNIMYPQQKHIPHIASTAVIHKTATIGNNCYIGNFSIIGENVHIGDDVYIGHNTQIENGCKIGNNSHIRNNVSISHSIIGKHALINSGASIGESGFGIIPTGKNMLHIAQLGRVIIGDNVRIGANTTIDRGSINDTTIGNHTIIDNLVQIAHNVNIGECSIIVAQVGIAGSSKIGNSVVLAGQVGIAGHLNIEDNVVAMAKSGITSDIKAGSTIGGYPAIDGMAWKRQMIFLKNLVNKKTKKDK